MSEPLLLLLPCSLRKLVLIWFLKMYVKKKSTFTNLKKSHDDMRFKAGSFRGEEEGERMKQP